MRGIFNPKTGKYENPRGQEVLQESDGYSREEIEEMEEIERIEAEGGTYLDRYAKQLGVEAVDLFRDILANNSMNRFNSVRNYTEFTMLKQTLVEETGPMAKLKAYSNAIGDVIGDDVFGKYF